MKRMRMLMALAGIFAVQARADLTSTNSIRGDGKTVVKFTAGSGTWTVPSGVTNLDLLVVGGGGAALDSWATGGGGGGGVINLGSYSPSSGSVTVTVGAGGQTSGAGGSDSVFDNLTANGGGGGGAVDGWYGGPNGSNSLGGAVYAGGYQGSGAGAGGNGADGWNSASGGPGVKSSITGSELGYGGGGSSCYGQGYTYSVDGGGVMGYNNAPIVGHEDGYDGRGGGGASGGSGYAPWGKGGSGVVIVAYNSGVTVFTVSFNSNEGSPVASQNVASNSTATLPAPAPTKTGYTFVEWCPDSELNNAFSFSTAVTNDMTLYAKWTINSYTLTYSAGSNGSITGTTPQTVEYGGSGTAVTAVPDSGCRFVKWSDNATDNPRTDTNVIADITVEASFEPIPGPVSPDSEIRRSDGKTVATFSTVGRGIWTIPAGATEVEVLVVGGGGGGAGNQNNNGSGGAGGVYYSATCGVTGGDSVSIEVGAGGTGGGAYTNSATDGAQSVFDTIIAYGGQAARGNGGNSGGNSLSVGPPNGSGTGFSGGFEGGVGGGAGEAGGDYWYHAHLAANGLPFAITGASKYYGGGGGGSYGPEEGGQGGGGHGASDAGRGVDGGNDAWSGTDGLGGGGGASRFGAGGAGGSGVVIVAYKAPKGTLIMLY
ncbi:MAG: glycine-rich domain-containing protein [bacterium]